MSVIRSRTLENMMLDLVLDSSHPIGRRHNHHRDQREKHVGGVFGDKTNIVVIGSAAVAAAVFNGTSLKKESIFSKSTNNNNNNNNKGSMRHPIYVDDQFSKLTVTTDIGDDGVVTLSTNNNINDIIAVRDGGRFTDFERVDETFSRFAEGLNRLAETWKLFYNNVKISKELSTLLTSSSSSSSSSSSLEEGEVTMIEKTKRLYEYMAETLLLSSSSSSSSSSVTICQDNVNDVSVFHDRLMKDTETMVHLFNSFYETGLSLHVFEDDGYAETIGFNIVDEEETLSSTSSSFSEEEEEEEEEDDLEKDHPYEECVLSLCTSMLRLGDTMRRIKDMGVFNDDDEKKEESLSSSMMLVEEEEEELSFYAEINRHFTINHVNREDALNLAGLLYRWVLCLQRMASITNKRYPAHWRQLVRVLIDRRAGRTENKVLENINAIPLVRSLKSTYDKTTNHVANAMSLLESTM